MSRLGCTYSAVAVDPCYCPRCTHRDPDDDSCDECREIGEPCSAHARECKARLDAIVSLWESCCPSVDADIEWEYGTTIGSLHSWHVRLMTAEGCEHSGSGDTPDAAVDSLRVEVGDYARACLSDITRALTEMERAS